MDLTRGDAAILAVGNPIDGQRAGTANAFTAVVIEVDRLGAFVDQALVDDVQHLQKRSFFRNILRLVGFDAALVVWAGLTPDLESELQLGHLNLASMYRPGPMPLAKISQE